MGKCSFQGSGLRGLGLHLGALGFIWEGSVWIAENKMAGGSHMVDPWPFTLPLAARDPYGISGGAGSFPLGGWRKPYGEAHKHPGGGAEGSERRGVAKRERKGNRE